MSRSWEFQIYRDEAGEFRGRFIAGNGELVYASPEGYKRAAGVVKAATRFIAEAGRALDAYLGVPSRDRVIKS